MQQPTRRLLVPVLLSLASAAVAFVLITVLTPPQPITATPSAASEAHGSSSNHLLPDSSSYMALRSSIEAERARLSAQYRRAATTGERASIIAEARAATERFIEEGLLPQWYGTAWDFNGTTETPRQGYIACGFFVTTVLRDAGWRVERTRLAQQASEAIIRSLVSDRSIKRFSNVPIEEFVASVRAWGTGIYVVGLDNHTGFVANTGRDVLFIHSSYVAPGVVLSERAIDSGILAASRYRVLGSITADDGFILKWLTGEGIPTRTR